MVSAFSVSMKWCLMNRDVGSHLNYEHRVFNSEEFLKTREPSEQLFYKKVRTCSQFFYPSGKEALGERLVCLQVLETYIFHSFLKDRLNRKMDSYARMELVTRSEMHK